MYHPFCRPGLICLLSVYLPRGTCLMLKISLTISTRYGTTSSVQYVKCSLIRPKESAALLFFRFFRVLLISCSVVGVIGSDERRQISSVCISDLIFVYLKV